MALLWPLSLQWNFYPKAKDVLPVMEHGDRDGKQWSFYFPSHYDADKVHWFPSAYLGRNPK